MADETLLSDLCSICNTNKSKYCCPGCAARTCSLPCYKRHKQWAQCTGKRDPTAYVKKSQLATPAGIDHDYNFLTSIERGLEKASREVKANGVEPDTSAPQKILRSMKPGWYADAGVTHIPAPKGLSRQRENRTHRSSKRNIIWTVEWIEPVNSRSIADASEKSTILEAYLYGTRKKPTKKRKHEGEDLSPAKKGTTTTTDEKVASEVETKEADASRNDDLGPQQEAIRSIVRSKIGETSSSTENANPHPDTAKEKDQAVEADSNPERHSNAKDHPESNPEAEVPATSQEEQPADPEAPRPNYHFFLHKPRTSSTRHVLIPTTPTTTLHDTLRGRTVLEFPTIYVFTTPSPPEDSFILEAAYLEQEKQEQQELEDALKSVQPGMLQTANNSGSSGPQGDADEFDSKRILDVLKQDLGAGF